MRVIVLTGSIATGKSTVAEHLQFRGYEVIDLDEISRDMVSPGHPGLRKLVHEFGNQILSPIGTLNRSALAEIIFSDEEAKEKVNDILHPMIFKEAEEQVYELRKRDKEVVFVDIPLYYESKHEFKADQVWVVYVPESIQIQRLMKRNNLSESEALARIQSQISIEKKREMADVVIHNAGTIKELRVNVDKVLDNL